MKTIEVIKAKPAIAAVDDLIIRVTRDINLDQIKFDEWGPLMDSEAEKIASALIKHLPFGVTERLTAKLMKETADSLSVAPRRR